MLIPIATNDMMIAAIFNTFIFYTFFFSLTFFFFFDTIMVTYLYKSSTFAPRISDNLNQYRVFPLEVPASNLQYCRSDIPNSRAISFCVSPFLFLFSINVFLIYHRLLSIYARHVMSHMGILYQTFNVLSSSIFETFL